MVDTGHPRISDLLAQVAAKPGKTISVSTLLEVFGDRAFGAVMFVLAAPLVLPRAPVSLGWWARFAINSAAGLAALGAGLWFFGRDGKMATYAVLVIAVATAQWLTARAWRA